ncbi:Acyl transferase domain-containing protein [Saccharopolyspora kobensis]|uniref:Acyl transferase domain-containing protein n=2 Tax=Saccharopolyspora kobensis TaxID=146035 RepID=A0A1H5UX04_9PSEU|nr:type I polyketide synthase [Saccharopolyspora kobensis]SEF79494.1 Acyl transferase domain-containing protein [Saccharopolyspora kobensis]SFC68053.1 myxalamid-type polyketide synthase MxaB [Saccharopolyspora kobensis]
MTDVNQVDGPEQLARQLLLEKYEPIAIVGVGIRYPGKNDTPQQFADFLRAGGDGTGPVPETRWDMAELQAAEAKAGRKPLAAGGGFTADADKFDPQFFSISPKEAASIDPQHRWALECAWRAFESANIDPVALRDGTGGVYLGVGQMDFAIEVESVPTADLDAHIAAGTAHSAAAGRLSYFLGWRGPCLSVDTACSSSLVSLHLAVQGLRAKECDIALAGGVNAAHHPRNHVVYSRAGMLSPDGKCKTFDDSADGYGRSEGCGMLLLKRLSDAKRDGDDILALVRGSAVRQDGESGGLTVPNGTAQAALMRAALDSAMLQPGDISYVEAHGTGTSLGDPIELGAIDSVFASSRPQGEPLLVGSVKTNIGHMEAAAGVGGVTKVIEQMRAGEIFPHINLTTPSRHIPWDRYRVKVPTELCEWPARPRRALVNSFGFAGTIASVVLEQAPPSLQQKPAEAPQRGTAVFTLSAKTAAGLHAQARSYRQLLDEQPDISIADLCYTGNVGRTHLPARIAAAIDTRDELVEVLDAALARRDTADSDSPTGGDVAFMFSGQGSQYVGMGRALHQRYPAFAAQLDECDRLFAEHLGRSIKEIMFGEAPDSEELIDQTRYTQPALFALEYALAALWMSWGVRPNVLIGHSIGEITAAAVAGLFSLPDAVKLVAVRGRMMQSVSEPGGMLAVEAAATDVEALLAPFDDVSFGAVNGPRQCVISGGVRSLEAIAESLRAEGIKTKRLSVSHAFHSPLMAEVAEEFLAELSDITFHEPQRSFVSNLTGESATLAEVGTPSYWVRHIAEPVNFAAGIRKVLASGARIMIEVGPGAALTGLGRAADGAAGQLWLTSLSRSEQDGATAIRSSLAKCYTAGLPVSWPGYHDGAALRRIPLPGYVFDKKSYRLPAARNLEVAAGQEHHPLLGREITNEQQRAAGEREFRTALRPDAPGYLADHIVGGQVVFPGAGYAEIVFALQDAVFGETRRLVREMGIHEPLYLTADAPTEVRTRLRDAGDDQFSVEIVSRVEGNGGDGSAFERRHVTALIGPAPAGGAHLAELIERLGGLADETPTAETTVDGERLYARYVDLGLPYGPAFRRVRSVARHGAGLAIGELRGIDEPTIEHLTASVLDCAMQTVGAIVELGDTYLPVAFDAVELLKKPKGDLRVLITPTEHTDAELVVDLVALEGRRPVFAVRGVRLKRVANPLTEAAARMLVHPRWIKRSLVSRQPGRAREILVVRAAPADFAELAGPLAAAGLTLHFAADASSAGALLARHPAITDLCWFWRAEPALTGVDRLRAECEENYRDLLELTGLLDEQGPGRELRVQLVTEGGQWLPADDADGRDGDALAAASLWGFGHVLLNEYPAMRATLIDLEPAGSKLPLVDEWANAESSGGEFQIAYRGGNRHVKRLWPNESRPAGDDNFELSVTEYGQFGAIKPVPVPDTEPVGDEVTVQVHAAGLNFKDVLNALGMLHQYAVDNGLEHQHLPLGFEAAGTVVAAGPDAEFRPGQQVMLSRLGCLRRRVTVPSAVVVAKPDEIGFAEAAALPAAYVTAYHALHHLAKIQPGDRVLIHAAAGGVGQAAVQLATRAGATVYATASPRKWPLLHEQGVAHVMNSRTLDFADQLLEATEGRGVDIVLNSLSNDFVPASARCLAEGGRFVELGKIGIWSPEQMRERRPDVEYHNFDLSELPAAELDSVTGKVLRIVADGVRAGEISPPPTTSYSLDEVEEAFGVLSRGANIGKLVLDLTADAPAEEKPVRIGQDETYLITGGLGALGEVTAGRLAAAGARRIALVGRREIDEQRRAELAARLGPDVQLSVHRADIASESDVAALLAELPAPLGGVVHAAGVLADAPVAKQTWESMREVFAAKIDGSWLLHRAVADLPSVRFFVTYSSISAVLGAAGQANYAAANAFMDTLMAWRRAAGSPALSVNWGPWAEVGMAAKLSEQQIRGIAGRGIQLVEPGEAMRALLKALGRPAAQAVVGKFDWGAYTANLPWDNQLFSRVRPETVTVADTIDPGALIGMGADERAKAITGIVREKVAQVLRFDSAGEVDSNARFVELGLDSLAAVELKNALEAATRVPLPTSIVFDHPSIGALARFIDSQVAPDDAPVQEDQAARDDDGDVQAMSDAEADAELAALRELTR